MYNFRIALSAVVLVAPSFRVAAAGPDNDVGVAMKKLADLGPGVHAVKKDGGGRVTSVVVVGQARVSTVLGKAKGLEVARDRARLDASAQLVKWVSEKVTVHQTTDEETILFLEGSEDNDKAAPRESGKAVEKTTKKVESVAQGMVRGLQVLHVEVNAADKTYTLVLGWEAKTAEATKGVGDANGAGEKPAEPAAPAKPAPGGKPSGEKIDGKSATSPDAKRFLP